MAFGGSSAHKNISRLLSAFQALTPDFTHSLVLLGHLPPGVDLPTSTRKVDISGAIRALGYVPREHIRPILASADLFVLPSLYEGFGLPALEAQSSGVPMACSNAGSLPEVAGDGAIYFDPRSVSDMSKAMRRCLSEPDLAAALRERGHRNVERFGWAATARETIRVYRRTCSRTWSRKAS